MEGEIASSPVLLPGMIALSTYQSTSDVGDLLLLEPEVSVTLLPSLPSPQKLGEEISFTVVAAGFSRPRFEFSIIQGEKQLVVQKETEKNTWTWFPSAEGNYVISVRVRDEKKTREASLPFQIIKEETE